MHAGMYQYNGGPHMSEIREMNLMNLSDAGRMLAADKQKAKNEYKAPWTPEVPPSPPLLPRNVSWIVDATLSAPGINIAGARSCLDRDVDVDASRLQE